MAMNLSSGGGEPEVMMDINTTPLIDVMLVLLVMLIITIPIQLHTVNLNMPAGNPPPPVKELADRPALEAKLAAAAVGSPADQPEVHIRPNKLVEYKSVAMVLASAQRLGVSKLGMVGNEQFVK